MGNVLSFLLSFARNKFRDACRFGGIAGHLKAEVDEGG